MSDQPTDGHVPMDVNPKYDEDGLRTHQPPSFVCRACSEAGPLIPVDQCKLAAQRMDAEEAWIRGDGEKPAHLMQDRELS